MAHEVSGEAFQRKNHLFILEAERERGQGGGEQGQHRELAL